MHCAIVLYLQVHVPRNIPAWMCYTLAALKLRDLMVRDLMVRDLMDMLCLCSFYKYRLVV